MSTSRTARGAAIVSMIAVVACGHRKDSSGSNGSSSGSPAPAATTGAGATITSGTLGSAATTSGPSDRCVGCRDAKCSAEVRACEGDTVCARNMGCKEECKGDKPCMSKCVRPTPKFSALGRCLVGQCKAECLSP